MYDFVRSTLDPSVVAQPFMLCKPNFQSMPVDSAILLSFLLPTLDRSITAHLC